MTGTPDYLLDTNILVRFLRNDHPQHSPASRRLFDRAKAGRAVLHIPFVTVIETLHVLRSFYKVDRAVAARELVKIFNAPGVRVLAPAWLQEAINVHVLKKVSLADALIAAEARHSSMVVASFDGDFESLDAKLFVPK